MVVHSPHSICTARCLACHSRSRHSSKTYRRASLICPRPKISGACGAIALADTKGSGSVWCGQATHGNTRRLTIGGTVTEVLALINLHLSFIFPGVNSTVCKKAITRLRSCAIAHCVGA